MGLFGNSLEEFQSSGRKLEEIEVLVLSVFSGGRAEVISELWPHVKARRTSLWESIVVGSRLSNFRASICMCMPVFVLFPSLTIVQELVFNCTYHIMSLSSNRASGQ